VLGRSVALNVLGRAANLGIGLVSSVLIARWLGSADRGLLGIMTTAGEVALGLASVGLPMAVMYYASRRDARPGALLGDSLAYTVVLAAVLVPLAWLLREQIADLIGHGRGGGAWAVAALIFVPLTFLNWTTQNQLLGRMRFGLFNVLIALSKAVTLVAAVVLLGLLGFGLGGALVAIALGPLVTIGGSLRSILREARPQLDFGLLRRLLRYGGSVQVGAFFQSVNFRLDVIVVQFFVSLSAVGYYVIAQVIAELVLTLALAFQTSVLPLVTSYEGDARQAETSALSLRHHGLLALGATAANAVVGPLLVLYAYGPDYHRALTPFFVLLPGMVFLGTGLVVAGDLRGRGRPGLASSLTGIAVVFTVVLDLALIPPFGVVGAALASLVAYVAYGVVSVVALSRVSGIPVRELVVPTRADLRAYPAAARNLLRRVRPA
jgi:O-antigen/teichoic acid export membrane protein